MPIYHHYLTDYIVISLVEKPLRAASPPKGRKRSANNVDDNSESSSDDEVDSDENNSPSHSSRAEGLDGGETMDLDEDTDLNGQDSRRLCKTFQAEVCFAFLFLFFQLVQPLDPLQRPSWSSPKGPEPLPDDKDDFISFRPSRENQSGGKHHRATSALFTVSESDSDNGEQVSAGSRPNQVPGSPPQSRPITKSPPPKSRRQDAYDLEVGERVSLA